MKFEVEQKFRVADLVPVKAQLLTLGARREEPIVQVDRYFAHPARDFAQTDEALRIRQVGDRNFITYKGPKIDRVTKTRREIELPLGAGAEQASQWTSLLEAVGFREVTAVRKTRERMEVSWEGQTIEVALDQVAFVGCYVELELAADAATLDAARSRIQSLATRLGLSHSERRSYLELLLAAQKKSSPAALSSQSTGGVL